MENQKENSIFVLFIYFSSLIVSFGFSHEKLFDCNVNGYTVRDFLKLKIFSRYPCVIFLVYECIIKCEEKDYTVENVVVVVVFIIRSVRVAMINIGKLLYIDGVAIIIFHCFPFFLIRGLYN